jgi:hypothetical protein
MRLKLVTTAVVVTVVAGLGQLWRSQRGPCHLNAFHASSILSEDSMEQEVYLEGFSGVAAGDPGGSRLQVRVLHGCRCSRPVFSFGAPFTCLLCSWLHGALLTVATTADFPVGDKVLAISIALEV